MCHGLTAVFPALEQGLRCFGGDTKMKQRFVLPKDNLKKYLERIATADKTARESGF